MEGIVLLPPPSLEDAQFHSVIRGFNARGNSVSSTEDLRHTKRGWAEVGIENTPGFGQEWAKVATFLAIT